ncbi:hypothetical protein O1C46_000837 [Vibrio cholerae]|nr:hypothetical protein [Vibrio cholerae]EKF9668202.1 hypothetical protein [Vibrio cholerae]
MTEFRRQGQSGGGSAASVPSDQIFDSASLRDDFFAANPQRLIDGAQCVVLTSAPEGLYQVYTLGVWQDRSKVVIGRTGPQGLTGEKGDHVDSAEFVGDDIVFGDTGGRTFPLADAVNVLKGPQGEAAPALITQFSIEPNGPWVSASVFAQNPDIYFYWRWSTDNGVTWSPNGISVRATVTNLPNGFGWFDDGQGGLTLKKGNDVYLTMTPDEVQSKRLNVVNNLLKFGTSKSVHDVSENVLFKNNITGQVFHPVWQRATNGVWDATVRRPLDTYVRQNKLTDGFQPAKPGSSVPASLTITAQYNLRARAFYLDSLAAHSDCTMVISQGGKTKVIIEGLDITAGENRIVFANTRDELPFLDLLEEQTFLITVRDTNGDLINVREMSGTGNEGVVWWALDFTQFVDSLVLDARRVGGSIYFDEDNGIFDVIPASPSQLGAMKPGVGLAAMPDGTIYSTVSGSITETVPDEAARLALPQIAQSYTIIQVNDPDNGVPSFVYYLGANKDPSIDANWIKGGSTSAAVLGFKGAGDVTSRSGIVEAMVGDYTADMVPVIDSATGEKWVRGKDETGFYWMRIA